MVNVALQLGSIGLTLGLFGISLLLLLNDNPMWGRFFVPAVYLATWNVVWGLARGVASRLMYAVEDSWQASEYVVGTLIVYAGAFGFSTLVTWMAGGWMLGEVLDPRWAVLGATG